jgi:hypothetical protein
MSRKMELNELNDLFNSGEGFELTDIEYQRRVGKPLPKDDNYIKRRSPISRKAKTNGFEVQVEERAIKVLTFKKIGEVSN